MYETDTMIVRGRVNGDLFRLSEFLHLLDELGGGFAEFLFKCFGEIRLGLDADADHDFREGDVFVGHDLYGCLEADGADEIADGLVADAFYFLIEAGAAHAHFLAEVADLEIGVGQLGIDDLQQPGHELLVFFGMDELHGLYMGIIGVPLFQFAVLVETVADRQQEQIHV